MTWTPPPPRPREDQPTGWVWPIDRHSLEKQPNLRSPIEVKWRPVAKNATATMTDRVITPSSTIK